MTRLSTRHLVAPELDAGIDTFPSLDMSGGVEAMRAGFEDREPVPMPPGLGDISCEERHIPGANGAPDVRILHYAAPASAASPAPAVCHIHGGGYVIGTPELNDISNRAFAAALGCAVVSVDYRLAPEAQWPGALEDCFAALSWMHDNAADLGIDPDRIAIAGESAGGGHAAALAIHARNQLRETGSGPRACFQLFDAPMLDDRTGTSADPHPHTGEFVWTPEHNRFGWEAMLGVTPGGADVRDEMVPAREQDLSDLPPTFISVGALDLFLEEDMEFTRRLSRAGVPAELYVIPGAYHGFGVAGMSPQLEACNSLRMAALGRAFAS